MSSTNVQKRQLSNGFSNDAIQKEFIEQSTLHGLKSVTNSRSKTQRVIWFILLLSAVCYVIYLTVYSIMKYLNYSVITKSTIMFEASTIFPAVTICNFNRFNQEKAKAFGYRRFMEYYADPALVPVESVNLTSKQMQTIYDDIGMDLGLFKCKWKGQKCSIANFSTTITSMGKCYTFNSGTKGHPVLNSSTPGADYGLKLVLDVSQIEYMVNVESGGFKIMLHDQNVPPRINNMGVAIGPGSHVFASISKTEMKGKPKPYENACEDMIIPGYSTYSKSACMLTCYSSHVIKSCGCKTVEMKEEEKVCNFSVTETCVRRAKIHFDQTLSSKCKCTRPCSQIDYHPTLSYASFPSMAQFDSGIKKYPWIQKFSYSNLSYNSMIGLVKSNVVLVNVFYKDLFFELIESKPSFTEQQLFGEIGGQLGLFVGASLLTLYEFIDVIVDMILVNKRNRQIRNDELSN